MRRQLYRGGGIIGLYPRQKYGAGSFVQDLKDKVVDRFQKIVPNELADVAVKAAPFVAPFNPGVAGLMRGLGRLDQRGNLTDALKQGVLTAGLGAGARYLGGQRGIEDIMGGGFRGGLTNPISADSPLRDIFKARELSEKERIAKEIAEKKSIEKTPGFMQRATEATIGKVPGLRALPKMVQQKLLVGGAIAGASTLASYFKGDFRPQEEGESMDEYLAARKDVVGKQMRIYMDNYFKFDPEYSQLDDAGRNAFVARYNVAQGGRIGLYGGGEAGIKSLEAGAPDITYEGNEGPQAPMKMASNESDADEHSFRLFNKPFKDLSPMELDEFWEEMERLRNKFTGPVLPEDPTKPINPFAPKPTGPVLPDKMMAAKGGRIGYDSGTMNPALVKRMMELMMQGVPRHKLKEEAEKQLRQQPYIEERMGIGPGPILEAAKGGRIGYRMGMGPAGLPGIPRQAPDGMEYDMRQNGGFQGLGAKEGKDDVPAMLAKNEFVFTADAVRGAGGGDIELGAQRMYDTMKNLEKRVV